MFVLCSLFTNESLDSNEKHFKNHIIKSGISKEKQKTIRKMHYLPMTKPYDFVPTHTKCTTVYETQTVCYIWNAFWTIQIFTFTCFSCKGE